MSWLRILGLGVAAGGAFYALKKWNDSKNVNLGSFYTYKDKSEADDEKCSSASFVFEAPLDSALNDGKWQSHFCQKLQGICSSKREVLEYFTKITMRYGYKYRSFYSFGLALPYGDGIAQVAQTDKNMLQTLDMAYRILRDYYLLENASFQDLADLETQKSALDSWYLGQRERYLQHCGLDSTAPSCNLDLLEIVSLERRARERADSLKFDKSIPKSQKLSTYLDKAFEEYEKCKERLEDVEPLHLLGSGDKPKPTKLAKLKSWCGIFYNAWLEKGIEEQIEEMSLDSLDCNAAEPQWQKAVRDWFAEYVKKQNAEIPSECEDIL